VSVNTDQTPAHAQIPYAVIFFVFADPCNSVFLVHIVQRQFLSLIAAVNYIADVFFSVIIAAIIKCDVLIKLFHFMYKLAQICLPHLNITRSGVDICNTFKKPQVKPLK